MNLLYRASESISNFQLKVVNKLLKDNMFDKCVVISRSSDLNKINKSKRVKVISSVYAWEHRYADYIKEDKWYPMSREILEGMLPYEAVILELTMRDNNFDCYTVKQAKAIYYNELKFWNYIIDSENIDIAVFNYIPHVAHEFVAYCLCKIKKIPCLVFAGTQLPCRYIWGDSIENVGDNINEEYRRLLESSYINNEIDQDLQEYLNRHLYGNKSKIIINREQMQKDANEEIFRELNIKKIINKKVDLYNDLINSIIKKQDSQRIIKKMNKERKTLLYTAIDLFNQVNLKYYDRIAKKPDYTCRYIYFALQLQPEATTIPGAGVFSNQILSLEILAKSAKEFGIKIYVKEHWVQPLRNKEFYNKIKSIDNVELIKSDISSEILIQHAVAVSTQTGSCIIEGVLRKKCALVFGKVYCWKGMPGIFEVGSVKECKIALERILGGNYLITEKQLLTYFQAINNCSIIGFSYVSELLGRKNDFAKMEKDKLHIIEDFIIQQRQKN